MLGAEDEKSAAIQLTRTGVRVDVEQLELLRKEFAHRHCVVLPQLIEPGLLQLIVSRLAQTVFTAAMHRSGGSEEFAKDEMVKGNEVVLHLIHLLLNSPKLFQLIQQISECPPIGSFAGRIYRVAPGTDHHLDWHSDEVGEGRLIGLSVNFSSAIYHGGNFQLREMKTRQILCEVAQTSSGDAHIFRIAPDLQHRLTRLEGQVARIAAAGWFIAGVDSVTQLKRLWINQGNGSKEPLTR